MSKISKRYLGSFPRSGNTWIRHFFEVYTGKYSISLYTEANHDPLLIHPISSDDPCLIKFHFFKDYKNLMGRIKKEDKLVYLLRDFKDTFLSHYPVSDDCYDDNFDKYLKKVEKDLTTKYSRNLNFFQEIECSKLLIYYEDLVNDFNNEIKKIIDFFEFPINEEKIEEYLKNSDKNLVEIRKWYHKPIIDTNFISRYKLIYPDFVVEKINSLFKCGYPDICKKFLYRYFE